jgi:hypothetical protein
MKKTASLCLALAACSGRFQAPPPVPNIALPAGAALKPYDATRPGLARPEGMTLMNGNAYVTLANYDGNFVVRGPGLLAEVVPSTGAIPALIDLGGSDEQQCKNPGFVRASGNFLYVTCGGDFHDGTGQALVEVDATSNKVARSVALPVSPTGVTVTASRIWIGDAFTGDLYAVDKTSFAVVAGPVVIPCPANTAPPDPGYYQTVNEVLAVQGNLYALCSNSKDGVLSQLDPSTGAVKLTAAVGPIAVEMAETGDGRIAIVSGGDNGLRLVTIGASVLAVKTYQPFNQATTSTLQDVRARDNFVFTTASGSNTVQKIDLAASGGPQVIAEANVGASAAPWNLLPLDDDHALVSDQSGNNLVGVKWDH